MNAHANTGTVLDRILEARRAEVERRKSVLPETALKYGVAAASQVRDFSAALSRDALNVIAELKPASPSRGVIRDPFDAAALARALESVARIRLSYPTRPLPGSALGGQTTSLLPRIQELLGMMPSRPRPRFWPIAALPAAGVIPMITAAAIA